MTKEDIEKASIHAIRKHYGCAGKHPCSDLGNCRFCSGKNSAYDCNECGADEFNEGFIIDANWRINIVWHDGSVKPDTDKGDLLVIVQDEFGKDICFRQDAYYVLKYGCKRWAYIKDLIPNKEDKI